MISQDIVEREFLTRIYAWWSIAGAQRLIAFVDRSEESKISCILVISTGSIHREAVSVGWNAINNLGKGFELRIERVRISSYLGGFKSGRHPAIYCRQCRSCLNGAGCASVIHSRVGTSFI